MSNGPECIFHALSSIRTELDGCVGLLGQGQHRLDQFEVLLVGGPHVPSTGPGIPRERKRVRPSLAEFLVERNH